MHLYRAGESCSTPNYHSPCMPSRFALGRPMSMLGVHDTSHSDSAKNHRICLRGMEMLWDSFPGLLSSTIRKTKKSSIIPLLDVHDICTQKPLKPHLLKDGSIETTQSLSGKDSLWKTNGKILNNWQKLPKSSSTLCFSKIYLPSLYKNLALRVQQFTCFKRSPGTHILTANSGCNLFWVFILACRPLAYTQEVPVSTSSEIPCSNILWFGIIEDYTALIVKFFIKKLKTRNMLIRLK